MPHPTLVLDLEGTLISNAVSVFPRPELFWFLEQCKAWTPSIYVMTAVRPSRAEHILALLAEEGSVPSWFKDVPCVEWHGAYKDLGFVPVASPDHCILVDDLESYVLPSQRHQWFHIPQFVSPYDEPPGVLRETFERLQLMWVELVQ